MNKGFRPAVLVLMAFAILGAGCRLGRQRKFAGTQPEVPPITPGGEEGLYGDGSLEPRPFLGQQPAVDAKFENVLFAYDSASISESERPKIEAVADYMRKNPSLGVILSGHCDERGSREYNMGFGERRAQAVRAYLIGIGIDAAAIQTKSYGKEMPLDPGHTEEAWRVNRRVEFSFYNL